MAYGDEGYIRARVWASGELYRDTARYWRYHAAQWPARHAAHVGWCEGRHRLTKREAERQAWRLFIEQADANAREISFSHFVELKFRPYAFAGLRRSDRHDIELALNLILPVFGGMRLRSVRAADIRRFAARLERRRTDVLPKCEAVRVGRILAAVLQKAFDIYWIPINPARCLQGPA
jgi:hypothetical protein